MSITGNIIGAILKDPGTIIVVDDTGKEYTAVTTGEEVVLTADENDVREGETFAAQSGFKTGKKVIPSYNTREGVRVIDPGSAFDIVILNCEYTKLQTLLCKFNSTVYDSVATDRVSIDNAVYPVNSTEAISTITVDSANQSIKLGVSNESDSPYVLRYFTYKEIY